MAERYRERASGPSDHIWQLFREFKKPHSALKRVHGPSKLRIEVKADEDDDSGVAEPDIDYRPVQSTLRLHIALQLRSENRLYQMTREGEQLIAARLRQEDSRKVPPENDAKVWEDLFGKLNHIRPPSNESERALDKRGCWINGRVAGVVEDEIFPGWAGKWEVDESEHEDSPESRRVEGTRSYSPLD